MWAPSLVLLWALRTAGYAPRRVTPIAPARVAHRLPSLDRLALAATSDDGDAPRARAPNESGDQPRRRRPEGNGGRGGRGRGRGRGGGRGDGGRGRGDGRPRPARRRQPQKPRPKQAEEAEVETKKETVIGGPAAAGAVAPWAKSRKRRPGGPRDDGKAAVAGGARAGQAAVAGGARAGQAAAGGGGRAQRMPGAPPRGANPNPRRRRRRGGGNRTKTEQQPQQSATRRCVCGYCGEMFVSRSKLFRHLRELNDCRKIALSHGMPLENPIKAVERRLRRRYGDLLLAGCIVLRVKPDMASEPRLIAFRKSPRGLLLGKGDVSPYECVIVRGNEGKQKPGFPKGKIEPVDGSILGAALRETWEEAGLKADQLRVLPASAEAAANASVCLDAEDSRMFADDEEVLLDETSDVIVSDESPAPAEDFPDLEDDVDAADLDRDAADDRRYASVDVREVTGRSGKRARYFVCGLSEAPRSPPKLTTQNDVDGDIADVSWVDVNAALLLLERKRRAALRRAVLIFAADERALATQATRDQAP